MGWWSMRLRVIHSRDWSHSDMSVLVDVFGSIGFDYYKILQSTWILI